VEFLPQCAASFWSAGGDGRCRGDDPR
jgi:hypothetical protein